MAQPNGNEPIHNEPTLLNIEDDMRQSYLDYAMSVNIGRALPDMRDGLKPVHRRILIAMFREGLLANRRYSKCAGVVGEVLKRYHPHGDSAVYDALVRMAQPWSMRYPLIDGQGNFGSIDGDPPAAYRYTECRLTRLAERMLADIDKDTVDFIPNFDGSDTEPEVLPAQVPNLLINGSDGIAVGMATNIPPHNLGEVCDAMLALIENPDLTLEKILDIIPGPDFPTGGQLLGRQAVRQAYLDKRGILTMRALAVVETDKRSGRASIIVREIPYQVNKTRLIERIAELVNDRRIEGISDLRDESDRDGMRIVIELKRDDEPKIVLNQLFKLTQMQESYGLIMLAIHEGRPREMDLREMLVAFLDHRRRVMTRRTQFELRQAEARLHVLEGLLVALQNLDAVIKLIRAAKDAETARNELMDRFKLSQIQAQAILDLTLRRLTSLERGKIEDEHKEILANDHPLPGDPRRRARADEAHRRRDRGHQEGVRRSAPHPDYRGRRRLLDRGPDRRRGRAGHRHARRLYQAHSAVALSHPAARRPRQNRRDHRRGGFRRASGARSRRTIGCCSSPPRQGLRAQGYELPEGGRAAKGRSIANLLSLERRRNAIRLPAVPKDLEGKYVFFATRRGRGQEDRAQPVRKRPRQRHHRDHCSKTATS